MSLHRPLFRCSKAVVPYLPHASFPSRLSTQRSFARFAGSHLPDLFHVVSTTSLAGRLASRSKLWQSRADGRDLGSEFVEAGLQGGGILKLPTSVRVLDIGLDERFLPTER